MAESDVVDSSPYREKALLYYREYNVPAFLAGVFLILLLVVLDRGVQQSLSLSLIANELLSPVRTALIGLGTGYYLGAAIDEDHSSIVAFHVGAFATLLVLSFMSIGLGNSAYLLIIAVLFALFMNTSNLIDHDEIQYWFDGLARDGSRAFLVLITAGQYALSLLQWTNTRLSDFTQIEKGIILAALVLALVVALWLTQWFTSDSDEGTRGGKGSKKSQH